MTRGTDAGMAPADSDRPETGTVICNLVALPDPAAIGVRLEIASGTFAGLVVRVGDDVAGFVDACPHLGQPLSRPGEPYLTPRGGYLLCAGHGALFRRLDGVCVAGPCAGERLAPWALSVVAGNIVSA